MSNQAISIPAFEAGGDDGTRATDGAVRMLLVTGISGAGKTSALKALEDLGYEAVDNLPLSLLGNLVLPRQRDFTGDGFQRPLAVGVDIRTRDFGVEPFLRALDHLIAQRDVEVRVLFLDCDDEELRRRFTETRHRHPLAGDRPIADGIAHERRLISPIRPRADVTIDTTGRSPGDLKRLLSGHFSLATEPGLTVFVTSFSYRQGLPRDADLVFDVRFLVNPHYDATLKPLSGRDQAVADFITADGGFAQFFDSLTGLLLPLLPRFTAEGKSYLTIAIGCTGGRHRSVFVAEKLAAWLASQNQRADLRHRDLNPD